MEPKTFWPKQKSKPKIKWNVSSKVRQTYLEAIWKQEFSMIAENFDIRENVVPTTTVQANNIIL